MQTNASCIPHFQRNESEFGEKLRKGLRASAISVSLLTTRDNEGGYHGLAVTNAAPFSTAMPTMMVAVSQSASSYATIQDSRLYCLNHITSNDMAILDRFCRSDMRSTRFSSNAWQRGLHDLPYLETATSSFFCSVIGAHDYGDHTVFVGRIEGIWLREHSEEDFDPVIWINGAPRRLAEREYA
ncbi:flavin reductase family protein [Mesorhizobium sp. YR577]|uniref:flavin reductase family protein n=1 Tax=Mesorhizobium sp. YR577 TaxID=1884373 RepID=UPI0008F3BC81|nr:flavin reductase family protein [Mesorhizobium sp. YR577]SFU16819.1 NADH-FMN oxidoreductase RutF, flavin reductase (DIM6/NTAB) family [Mesorhizobium sp. YR577]